MYLTTYFNSFAATIEPISSIKTTTDHLYGTVAEQGKYIGELSQTLAATCTSVDALSQRIDTVCSSSVDANDMTSVQTKLDDLTTMVSQGIQVLPILQQPNTDLNRLLAFAHMSRQFSAKLVFIHNLQSSPTPILLAGC